MPLFGGKPGLAKKTALPGNRLGQNKVGLGPSPNVGVPRTSVPPVGMGNKMRPPSVPPVGIPQQLPMNPQTGMGINRPFMGRGPSPDFGLGNSSPVPPFNPDAMTGQMGPSPQGLQELMQRMRMKNTGIRNPMMGM